MNIIQKYFTAIYALFFPNICMGCGKEMLSNEKYICTKCIAFLPKTKFHLHANNPMELKLLGRVKIENATSFYYFNKETSAQNMVHALKYRGKYDLGIFLGKLFANHIEDATWIKDIDCIIPVPLSKQKLNSRGYNQCESLAKGMSDYLNIPVNTLALIKKKHTLSQTKKNRFGRLANVQDVFEVSDRNVFENKHVLVIDDVITTGATLESCVKEILLVKNTKVSIVTLAYVGS